MYVQKKLGRLTKKKKKKKQRKRKRQERFKQYNILTKINNNIMAESLYCSEQPIYRALESTARNSPL